MKWSEQMRILQSEDEHYNQLMIDSIGGQLYINDELIYVINISETPFVLPYDKFEKIKRKYPFFDDLKFLLNCIFYMPDDGNETGYSSGPVKEPCIHYKKFNYVIKYDTRYELCSTDGTVLLRIYFKES